MSDKKIHRCKSGAEILRIYIPDYKKEPLTIEEEAELVGNELVSKFGDALRAAIEEMNIGKDVQSEKPLA